MLQLRPGQCATGHDGGVGGQPRRIDASAPIAAPHRCVSPSRRGTRSALGFAQTCRAVTAGYDRRMRYVCCMPAGHITASAPIATPSRRGTRSALRCAQTCRAVSRVRPACCMPAGHARAHTHAHTHGVGCSWFIGLIGLVSDLPKINFTETEHVLIPPLPCLF